MPGESPVGASPENPDIVITTRTSEYWFEDEGTLAGRVFPGARQNLAEANEILDSMAALLEGRAVHLLIDLRGIARDDRATRARFASADAAAVWSKMAVVTGSGISRVIGNFYMGLNKPPMPTRLFSTTDEARAWLKSP